MPKKAKSKTAIPEGNDKPEGKDKPEKKRKKGVTSTESLNAIGNEPDEELEKKPKDKKNKGDSASKTKLNKKGLKNLTPEEVSESRRRSSVKVEPTPEAEWNSEEVIAHKLQSDGFTYSMVLAMEDSSELTSIGHYLDQAIKTGIRKTFMGINGEEIASKVKKFLSASAKPSENEETNAEEFWERMDIWAEAIKHILIKKKQATNLEMAAGDMKKELELTGARSKDMIRPLVLEEDKTKEELPEPPPAPPPSSKPSKESKKDKKDKTKSKDKKGKKKKNDLSAASESTTNIAAPTDAPVTENSPAGESGTSSQKLRSSNMRKRGELLMPSLEEINDGPGPAKGPLLYIVLQGFYNPKLLQELLRIGVPVDGILLLTDQEVTKRNFSVADIEDSIPGTFRPRNILPDYLKFLENQTTLPRPERDVVGQFWAGLAELYNTVPSDSVLLDCALMNLKLPKNEHGLESNDARGLYASKLFDDAAQRIYEMLVMSDWFHDYTACSTIKEIKPMEVQLEREIYENLLDQVPAECVTVPIIMECILEQVATNVEKDKVPKAEDSDSTKDPQPQGEGDEEAKFSEFNKFGKPGWGSEILQDGLKSLKKHNKKEAKNKQMGPRYAPPLYIKNGDFASIRACHLNETVAAHIAQTQASGDWRGVKGVLWDNIPEFNRGLYLKLLANLNHFMYFLPPDSIHIEDMFFIIHLLMSAGVEAQLRKDAETAAAKEEEEKLEKTRFSKQVHDTTTELFSSHTAASEGKTIDGTKLAQEHNYLALNEPTGIHFIMAPDSDANITIAPLGHSKGAPDGNEEEEEDDEEEEEQEDDEEVMGEDAEKVAKSPPVKKGRKSKTQKVRKSKAADIATGKVIEVAADLALEEEDEAEENEDEDEGFTEGNVEEEDAEEEEEEGIDFGEGTGIPRKDSETNRFIACEPEFFKDMQDFSVFKALLECPALLAISESGALDISKWVETYLLSAGLSQIGGDGVLIGNLVDWNFVEELVPIQTVQVLNNALSSYLSMQRMYCPFYDTLLFIFNNPTPVSLKSDSQFYKRLKTLPGLQHFLEFTIHDDDVLSWLMGMQRNVGVEVIDSLSITTLMKIVPEEQWLLVPSIKYMLYKQQTGQLSEAETKMIKSATDSQPSGDTPQDPPAIPIAETEDKGDGDASSTKVKRKGQKDKKKSKKKKDVEPEETKTSKKNSITEIKAPPTPSAEAELDAIPSFHVNDAIQKRKNSKTKQAAQENQEKAAQGKEAALSQKSKFDFYDLGKRCIIVACDTYHLFPMDGTLIQYDISTIEPEFRMMQLTVAKNGHNTYFYPYYIPHDLDLSKETYVVCPYFHMVHANGTIFAFQDRRATESAPYIKVLMRQSLAGELFSYDKVIFGDALPPGATNPTPQNDSAPVDGEDAASKPPATPPTTAVTDGGEEEAEEPPADVKKGKKKKKGAKGEETKPTETESATTGKKKKKKGAKSEVKVEPEEEAEEEEEEEPDGEEEEAEGIMEQVPPPFEELDEEAEWVYSDGELTDPETGVRQRKKRRQFYAFSYKNAEVLLEPMVHTLKISLPSGLMLEVDDVPGPPLMREVKQSYGARGSAAAKKESSRYYTMNGTVIKFMLNGTIQILTARGVTTNIRAISTTAQRVDDEKLQEAFETAHSSRIADGDVILPDGEFWHIVEGKKVRHDPIFVFSSGPLPNGEIFRRRQDGLVFLHRHDGTTITHYPDGTRFTTRMIVQRDLPEELDGWVVVGLKYMIEHPNYCGVIFNTLSGNSHIRLPLGDWVRIFADGTCKVNTTDNYSMDVDKYRAVLSYPPCGDGDLNIPNLTAVKLWHSKDLLDPNFTPPPPKVTSPPAGEQLAEEEGESEMTLEEQDAEEGEESSVTKVRPSKQGLNGKKTRGGGKARTTKSLRDSTKRDSKTKTSITVEGLDGEVLEEESYLELEEEEQEVEEEEENFDEEWGGEDEELVRENKPTPEGRTNIFGVQDFLQFTDATLLCKAIDSWDNRFAVDVYGETFVDRIGKEEGEGGEEEGEGSLLKLSAEELVKTLSEHCGLTRDFLSGMLKTTSSDALNTALKRVAALKKTPVERCGVVTPTKIIVVKRNLSGYEFLKESQVEGIMNKAKNCLASMVLVDPLPSRDPRKYITIMEPVKEFATPQGMWTNTYREPTFRPALATNKHLKLAKLDSDLRWFGYVLERVANTKRPNFIPNPRADFIRRKEAGEFTVKPKQGPGGPPPTADVVDLSARWGQQEDTEEEEMESLASSETVGKSGKKKGRGKGKSEKLEKPQKESKGKLKNKKSKKEKLNATESNPSDINENGSTKKLGKQNSGKVKKNKKGTRKTSVTSRSNNDDLLQTSEEEEEDEEEEESLGLEEEQEAPRQKIRLDQTEIGQYPKEVKDVKGIYDDDEPQFQAQFHDTICTEKKAIVVRSFVEIPQIDEKMERAILAASVSYAQTVGEQLEVLEENKFVDPRSEEEKTEEAFVKQQLIENNLSDMHLLEQKAGRVLRFHF